MAILGNVFWFITGGFVLGLSWWIIGVLAYVSIIGIPWGKSCFVIGTFSFFPFGKEAIDKRELNPGEAVQSIWAKVGNLLWFLFAGFWLALGHVGAAMINFITVIGIPFGIQHLKLAAIALFPIGKTIVEKEMAEAARKLNGEDKINQMRQAREQA